VSISVRATEAEVTAAIAGLPRMLAGTNADVGGVARGLQLRIGVTLLSQIQQAFIAKARGGVGSDGIKWKPMKPASIAARRITGAEKKAAGVAGKRTRGLLTPAQDKRWRMLFATRKAWLMAKGMGAGEASGVAAAVAWKTLKSEGAQTRLSVFGNRTVEMVRDTGKIFRSLSPGVEDRPYKGKDSDQQVFEVPTGKVIVGTRVPYASRQHAMRPFWPERIPAVWWDAIKKSLARGLALVMRQYLSGRAS